MSDFSPFAGTQHSMPSANAGTVHAISKFCLKLNCKAAFAQSNSLGLHPFRKHPFS